jgi:hypothetical protein
MSFQSCLDEIATAAGRALKEEELEALEQDLSRLNELHGEGAAQDATRNLVEKILVEKEVAAKIQARNAVINKLRRVELFDYITNTWADRPELGLEAALVGVTKGAKQGAHASAAATQGTIFAKHAMGLVADMNDDGVWRMFVSGEMDRDIYRAIHEIDKPEPNLREIPDEAVMMARAIQKHTESLRILANQHGANIGRLPGYLVKQTHDYAKIYRNKDEWHTFIRDNLDWERSFPDIDLNNKAEVDEVLNSVYVSLASGVHLASPGAGNRVNGIDGSAPPEMRFVGIANIGKKMSHERVLNFKDADAEFEYNRQFGAGKLTEGVIYGMEKMAQDIGVMQHFGPNADANLRAVQDMVLRRLKKEGDVKRLQRAKRGMEKSMSIFWPQVNGLARVPGNHMLAQASQTARAVQQWSKLGGAVISGIADIGLYASEVSYGGGNIFSGMGEALTSISNNTPARDRARLLSSLGVMHDGLISAASKRFDASDNAPGKVSSITSLFFKYNGLRWWTDQLRSGFALARSHDLALQAGNNWDALSPDTQRVLGLYGLDSAKWDIVRMSPQDVDGRAYLTAEGVEELGDEPFIAYLNNAGLKPTRVAIRNLRQEVAGQFRSYFFDRSTTASLEPNSKTQGITMRGTQPGTVEGESLRHLMLFKSFITAVVQRPLAREFYGRGAMDLKTSLKNGNGEMQGLAQLMVMSTVFGYAAMSIKDLLKGKTVRDPLEGRTMLAALAQGGAMGIYGDFLFGDMKNRYGGGAVSTLAGPTAGTIDSIADLFQRARDGDDTAAAGFRTILNNTPFINLFYTKWALDYLFLHQMSENLSPGYLRRMERRVEKETGQSYLFPPSQYAAGL